MADFYKEKLIQARLFWGYSLQKVGDELDVSKQYIQQLENGVKFPNEMFVEALAEVLEVLPGFFRTPISNVTLESQCHFRKARTTKISVKERALQQSSLFESLIQFINNEICLPEINFIEAKPLNNEAIEQAAEECRKSWKVSLDVPIKNMSYLLEKSGAIITNFTDISDKVDAFSLNKIRPIVIVNPDKKACRRRFDLAHECGHLILHNGIETGDVETERQANNFASALLLPRGAFLREFSSAFTGYRIDWRLLITLKRKWKVSLAAIVYRAYDLGIISASKYRSAFIYLSNKGYTKNEPLDDDIEIEKPSILNKSLEMLENNGQLDYYLSSSSLTKKFFSKLSGYTFKEKQSNVVNISSYL